MYLFGIGGRLYSALASIQKPGRYDVHGLNTREVWLPSELTSPAHVQYWPDVGLYGRSSTRTLSKSPSPLCQPHLKMETWLLESDWGATRIQRALTTGYP